MTDSETPPPHKPVSIGDVIRCGIDGLTQHPKLFLKTGFVPVFLLFASHILSLSLHQTGGKTPKLFLGLLVILLIGASYALVLSFAVSWRRYFVLRYRPPVIYVGSAIGRYFLWLCLGYLVLIFALAIILESVSFFAPLNMHHNLKYIYLALNAVPAIWLLLRYDLYLTAKALGNHRLGLERAFDLMKGNALPGFIGCTIVTLPMIAGEFAIRLALEGKFGPLPVAANLALFAVAEILTFATLIVSAAISALVYKRVIPGASPPNRGL